MSLGRRECVMTRAHYLFGWGFVAVCGALLLGARPPHERVSVTYEPAAGEGSARVARATSSSSNTSGSEWFRRVRPYCNSVEVRVLQRQSAPPATTAGAGY